MIRRRTDGLTGSAGTVLVAWCAVALAIAMHRGQYLLSLLVLALAGMLALATAVIRPDGARVSLRTGMLIAGVVVAVAGIVFGPTRYSHGPALVVSRVAAGLAGVSAAALLFPETPRESPVSEYLPWLCLLLGTIAGAARILATPHPEIDVNFLLQDSAVGLLHGRDMYHQCWPGSHGLKCAYPYLPITTVLLLPARVLTGDVRYGELAALVAAVVVLGRGMPRRYALLPLLLVVFPQAPYSLLQAWTEPLLVVCLVVFVTTVRTGRVGWATLALAVALAAKQHIALLVPLAAWWPQFGPRRTASSAGLALLMVLPWVLAGPRAFWHDVVTLNLSYPVLTNALDVDAALAHLGVVPGFALTCSALAAAYLIAMTRLPRTSAGFALGGALVLLALDLTNKQSFFNHYTLPMSLMVIAVCETARDCSRAHWPREPTADRNPAPARAG